jgi:transcriptional regulator with PAS, ATPase and Fis domain
MTNKNQFDFETYRELFGPVSETLGVGFLLIDYEYNILEINERLLIMLDKMVEQKNEYMGSCIEDFFQDREQFVKWDESLRKQNYKTTYHYEDNLLTLGGPDRAVLVSVHLLPDVEMKGKRNGLVTVLVTDIAEKIELFKALETANQELLETKSDIENKNKMLEAILFGVGDCVTIFDLEGRLLLSNPRGDRIRSDPKKPLLPLESGITENLTLTIEDEPSYFTGRMEGVYDVKGELFAYVETLKDITHEIELENRNRELLGIKRELKYELMKSKMIGSSRAMQAVFDVILRCSGVASTVVILGETGVGKEMAARAIHENSPRKDKPFVAINCGALPDALMESELFGHVKGAFTGATTDRIGLFREADGGTLFLDEVGDLKLSLQVKLLRALQEEEIRAVGGTTSFPVDVRIISATNQDLKTLVEKKIFRHDLYYRLAVIPITIPALRDRKEDILPLANHFVKKQAKRHDIQTKRLSRDAQGLLINYSWPGNIRELENAIEYALAMAPGEELTSEDFPMQNLTYSENGIIHTLESPDTAPKETTPPYPSLKNLKKEKMEKERDKVFGALRLHEGNRTLAAKELGISKSTLWRKIKKYELDR